MARSNPKNIRNFNDIAENGLSFINRQKGAGTRLLTDKILRESELDPSHIPGYDHEEYTHMNVAAAVANGSVDAGMGIRAAAEALEVDFVPIAEERYDLIIPTRHLDDPRVLAALDLINNSKELKDKIRTLGGYSLRDSGAEMYSQ